MPATSIVIGIFSLIFLGAILNRADLRDNASAQQQNSPPVVKILSPGDHSTVAPGAQVRYSITVSDKEDGESKYDEVNTKEVMLRVAYIRDTSALSQVIRDSPEKEPAGLTAMRSSNCFNCHAFDWKAIGPAFTDIRKRYEPTPENMASLERRVREGSAGIWGEASMPTHPELSDAQIHDMIKWIMENASDNNTHYYIGTKGSFTVPESVDRGAFLFTATYLDHGVANGESRQQGGDSVVIKVK
jgi:cytochrome c